MRERLLERTREAEVVGAREVLAGAVQPPRRRELLRAHETEPDAEVGADEVLAALAARQREVRGFAAEAPGHVRQELGVLVVGVRADRRGGADAFRAGASARSSASRPPAVGGASA